MSKPEVAELVPGHFLALGCLSLSTGQEGVLGYFDVEGGAKGRWNQDLSSVKFMKVVFLLIF